MSLRIGSATSWIATLTLAAGLLVPAVSVALHGDSERRGRGEHRPAPDRYDEPSAPAWDRDYGQRGVYAGFGAVGAIETYAGDLGRALDESVDVDGSAGFNVRLGARHHLHFATDLEYEWLDGFRENVAGVPLADVRVWTLMANARFYPIGGRIQPYALIGAGALRSRVSDPLAVEPTVSDADFALRMGGGIDFYLTRQLALQLQTTYVLPTRDLDDLDHVSVGAGLAFHF